MGKVPYLVRGAPGDGAECTLSQPEKPERGCSLQHLAPVTGWGLLGVGADGCTLQYMPWQRCPAEPQCPWSPGVHGEAHTYQQQAPGPLSITCVSPSSYPAVFQSHSHSDGTLHAVAYLF